MIVSRLLLIGTLLLVLALGAVSTAKLTWDAFRNGPPTAPSAAEIIDGRATAGITKQLATEVAVRPLAINLLNAAAFYVFGEARHGMLIGADDWLFSREEFTRTAHSEANIDAALHAMQQVIEALHERGVKVAVVLLPMKADIYGSRLGRYTLPAAQRELYADLLERVEGLGADYFPDIRTVLLQDSQTEQVFLKTDTHWTVQGAGATAASLCGLVSAEVTHAEIKSVAQATVQHRGDLLNFLDLGPFASGVAVMTEAITPTVAAKDADSEDALFGASDDFPITLVGTSYSANPLWSFKDQIETNCQASVLGVAVDGEGPFEPMADYLSKLSAGEFASPQLVVWEIPIRYVDDYDAKTLAHLMPDVGEP